MSRVSRVRACTWFLIVGLTISGLTAIPIQSELTIGRAMFGADWKGAGRLPGGVTAWLQTLDRGIASTAEHARSSSTEPIGLP
jgi:hypothetical protein